MDRARSVIRAAPNDHPRDDFSRRRSNSSARRRKPSCRQRTHEGGTAWRSGARATTARRRTARAAAQGADRARRRRGAVRAHWRSSSATAALSRSSATTDDRHRARTSTCASTIRACRGATASSSRPRSASSCAISASTNGTLLNGVRVPTAELRPGLVLTLGKTRLRVAIDAKVDAEIVGESAPMQQMRAEIARLAAVPMPVLDPRRDRDGQGAGGARAARSERAARRSSSPVNCGSLPKDLDRERDVRARARRLHRRRRAAHRRLPGGRRRHAVSRRDRRAARGAADAPLARARERRGAAGRRDARRRR